MSTKKKLIEATMFTRQGIYSDIDYTSNLVNLRCTLDMYMLKQNTPLTHDLLVKNGMKYQRVEEDDDCSPYHFYDAGFPLLIQRIKGGFFIDGTDIELKTVADIEDALDLCGIDKDIEIIK